MSSRTVLKRATMAVCVSVAIAIGGAGTAGAQAYPTKPIRIVVASSPGSVADTIARVLGTEMSRDLGQPIVVETKPGANQIVGIEYLAKQAPADGYTAAVLTVDALALLPSMTKDLRFDPIRDLQPVTGLVEGRLIFGSPAKVPWKTFEELIAYARANPGKLNYGSSASTITIPMAAVVREFGLDVTYIPYNGAASYFQALMAGDVQMGFVGEPSSISMGERFKVLAVTGDQRRPPFMHLPTFSELGMPYIKSSSHSLNVRAGTPQPFVERLHAAASKALQHPDVRKTLANLRQEPIGEGPEAAAKRLADQTRFYREMTAKLGLQPQ